MALPGNVDDDGGFYVRLGGMSELEGMTAILNGIKAAKDTVSPMISCPRCFGTVVRLNWHLGSQLICTDPDGCAWEGVRWSRYAG
jgi:hypothetical protein